MENKKPVAVVVCAGPGNGAALARRFDKAGYATAILSRHRSTLAPIESELTDTRGFECDVSDPTSVENAFTSIWSELGEVNALLYNAGSGVFGDIETITARTSSSRLGASTPTAVRTSGHPWDEGQGRGRDHLHRGDRIASRRRPNRGVRSGQGRAAQPS